MYEIIFFNARKVEPDKQNVVIYTALTPGPFTVCFGLMGFTSAMTTQLTNAERLSADSITGMTVPEQKCSQKTWL